MRNHFPPPSPPSSSSLPPHPPSPPSPLPPPPPLTSSLSLFSPTYPLVYIVGASYISSLYLSFLSFSFFFFFPFFFSPPYLLRSRGLFHNSSTRRRSHVQARLEANGLVDSQAKDQRSKEGKKQQFIVIHLLKKEKKS